MKLNPNIIIPLVNIQLPSYFTFWYSHVTHSWEITKRLNLDSFSGPIFIKKAIAKDFDTFYIPQIGVKSIYLLSENMCGLFHNTGSTMAAILRKDCDLPQNSFLEEYHQIIKLFKTGYKIYEIKEIMQRKLHPETISFSIPVELSIIMNSTSFLSLILISKLKKAES